MNKLILNIFSLLIIGLSVSLSTEPGIPNEPGNPNEFGEELGNLFPGEGNFYPLEAGDFPILSFRYNRVVNAEILTYAKDNSLYLPILEILQRLKIYHKYDRENQTIEGFFIEPDSTFIIDIKRGYAKYGNIEFKLYSGDYYDNKFEIFILPEKLEQLFGFDIYSSMSMLNVYIFHGKQLPVLLEYLRYKNYNSLGELADEYQPLLFDRNRKWLGGAMMDYNLQATQANEFRSYAFNTNLGLEALGGDLLINSSGFYNETGNSFSNNNFAKWRYYISDNPYLSQVALGDINNLTLRNVGIPIDQMRGVQLSNEAVQIPIEFNRLIIEDVTEPGWQVELYDGGELIDQQRADESGYFRFRVPVSYGGDQYTIRMYGPNGEFEEKLKVIDVPFDFMQPGEFRYTLSAGERRFYQDLMAGGRASLGITNWLSSSIQLNKYDGQNDLKYFSRVSIRPMQNISLFGDYFSDLYGAGVRWNTGIGIQQVSYKRFNGVSELNMIGAEDLFEARVGFTRFFDLPLLFDAQLTRRGFESNYQMISRTGLTYISSRFHVRVGTFTFGNYGTKNSNYESINGNLDVSYMLNGYKGMFSFLNASRFRINTIYDISNSQLSTGSLIYESNLIQELYLQIGIDHDFRFDRNSMRLNLIYNLPFTQSRTNGLYYDNAYRVNQEFNGIIGFDHNQSKVFMTNPRIMSGSGQGGASFRYFLDDNNNGIYDEGENEIRGVKTEIQSQGIKDKDYDNPTRRYFNLLPYSQVNVHVDRESFANPLMVPVRSDFSFIVDPNQFKPIDIPCYTAGIIEGSINDLGIKNIDQLSGLKLKIIGKSDTSFAETTSLYSDGTFYYMGLPPGEYKLKIDDQHLAILGKSAQPGEIDFAITQNPMGDVIAGLTFRLEESSIAEAKLKSDENSIKDAEDIAKNIEETKDQPLKEDDVASLNKNDEIKSDSKIIEDKINALKIDADKKYTILFDGQTSTSINKDNSPQLDAIADYLKSKASLKIAVVGHTDNSGTFEERQNLSSQRATNVEEYLISKGIAKSRILSRGAGSLYPVRPNTTEEGRKANRRVELEFIK